MEEPERQNTLRRAGEEKAKVLRGKPLSVPGIREGACEQVSQGKSRDRTCCPGLPASLNLWKTSDMSERVWRKTRMRLKASWRCPVGNSWGNNRPKRSFEELPWGEAPNLCVASGSTAMNQLLGKPTGTQGSFPEKKVLSNTRSSQKGMSYLGRKWVYHYWKYSRTSWMAPCQRCDNNQCSETYCCYHIHAL